MARPRLALLDFGRLKAGCGQDWPPHKIRSCCMKHQEATERVLVALRRFVGAGHSGDLAKRSPLDALSNRVTERGRSRKNCTSA